MEERKINIAMADDDEIVLNLLTQIINSDENLNIVGVANDGEELIQIAKTNKIDIILTDLFMPVVDGFGAISMIKSDDDIIDKPFCILMSSIKNEDIIKRSFKIGADYYLMKPFHRKMLLNVIHTTSISEEKLRYSCTYDDNTIYHKATGILKELGLPANMKGYNCLREAICMCLKDHSKLSGVTKNLYPAVGKLCGIENSERSMRYAIEVIYSRGNIDYMNKLFGHLDPNKDKPTVTEFLATIVDEILLEGKKI